jgi:hypothetical protein
MTADKMTQGGRAGRRPPNPGGENIGLQSPKLFKDIVDMILNSLFHFGEKTSSHSRASGAGSRNFPEGRHLLLKVTALYQTYRF